MSDPILASSILNAPIGICVLNARTLVGELVNDKFLEIAGKRREDILGKWYWDSFAEAKDFYESALNQVVVSGEAFYADEVKLMLIRHGKEEWVFVTFVYSPVKDDDGKVIKVTVWVLENTQQVNERKKVDEARLKLQVERDKLARFFHQLPAGVCIFNGEDLTYETVNPAYQKILPGRTLIGRSLFEALPELQNTQFQEDLLNVYRTGTPYSVNELMIPISEIEGGPTSERYFTCEFLPRLDENGHIDGIINFAYEVTQQVNARNISQESEKHFRQLADLVPVKISNALPTGEVTFFNKQWLDFSGLSFEDTRDFGYHQMMHPDEVAEFKRQLQIAAETKQPLISEMRFKNRSGEYIWHLNIASPVLDDGGEIKMWVGSTTDIQHLKDEEQRKSDFISMLSHELKTPVTSIKGYVQVLIRMLQGAQDLPTERLSPPLLRVNKLVTQLTQLIADMLDLTKIELKQFDLITSKVDLSEVVSSVAEDFRFTETTHTINISKETEVIVDVDKNKIVQVLSNLISNAIKYSPEADKVDIRVFKQEEGLVAVSVKDYGIGISETDQKQVFNRFYRVEGHSGERFTGFGIGLFIASSIIERHGGRITVDSLIGSGTTFTFILPTA